MMKEEVARLMDYYPKIYFACHTRHVEDKDTGVKLTANQVSILDHLSLHDPVTLLDLAAHMGVTPSTMSLSIDRIARLGYVGKEKDKADARKINLSLTAEGQKIKQSKSVLDENRVQAVLKRLKATERSCVLEGLRLLAAAAEMEMKERSFQKKWNNKNL